MYIEKLLKASSFHSEATQAVIDQLGVTEIGLIKHSYLVRKFSRLFVEQSSIFSDPVYMWGIEMGALLHDIGIMGVPKKIINKTEMLTDEEWNFLKDHGIDGKERAELLLRRVTKKRPELTEAITQIGDAILYHHENWDGTEYYGKKGEEIPLYAQIIRLSDSLESALKTRPNHRAYTLDEFIFQITADEQYKNHYNPELVELFVQFIQSNREAIEKSHITISEMGE